MILRSELFPAPEGPRITFVSPSFTSKETWSRILRPSTSTLTFSRRIILENGPDYLREDEIVKQHDHGRHHHRVHRGPPDAESSPCGCQAVVAADGRNEKRKNYRLCKS